MILHIAYRFTYRALIGQYRYHLLAINKFRGYRTISRAEIDKNISMTGQSDRKFNKFMWVNNELKFKKFMWVNNELKFHRSSMRSQNHKFTRAYSNMTTRFYSTSNEKDNIINDFWDQFYMDIERSIPHIVEEDIYNTTLFNRLSNYKNHTIIDQSDEDNLYHLQLEIENISRTFNENHIFHQTPNLIKLLIGQELLNAKYYLMNYLSEDLYNSTIVHFGEYTLEAILIYSLGVAFHSIEEKSIVKLSTLLALIDRIVITQANIMKSPKVDSSKESDISHQKEFEIGRRLIDFMIERKLIAIESISADDNQPVVKKKGKAYIDKHLFVVCNFDLSNLPYQFNFPMVCKPVDWQYIKVDKLDENKTLMLSDLTGGYLCSPPLNIHWGLISSHNLNNFNIELDSAKYKEMCSILNGLQKQGFHINQKVLKFIKKNRSTLEQMGLLMPGILARVNLKEAFDLLRKSFYHHKTIEGTCSLDALLKELSIRVQQARYEDMIIMLASAYEDFVFYLPAFMDFRGRIYRSGILHFHERDLCRGLIVFANNQEGVWKDKEAVKDIVATSAAFKYKKFDLDDEALQWYKENESLIYASDESFISFAKDASDPFQFIAKVLCDDIVHKYNQIPITQDASASAYQIMSYLLLNEEMAMRTNLIPHPDGKIQDLYTYLLQDFKEFIHHRINDKDKMEIIESKLDRKLIKRIFMPLIYGKTLISIEKDIRMTYGQLLSRKDTFHIAKLCDAFWIHKYPDIVNLMKLINIVSWLCSTLDKAITYSIPYFTTKQDYMAFKKESISVYERNTKKRRKVTLSIATTIRDKRKTQSATCANFIHQKDAYIAMKVVQSLLDLHVDIYTVHDNFLTTPPYVKVVPDIYTDVFIDMGHPLLIINHFITQNMRNSETDHIIIDESIPLTSDFLHDLLNFISPYKDNDNDPKKKQKIRKWRSVVSNFIKCYKNYVDSVCGNQVIDEHYNVVKWNQFKKLLKNRNHNYSVHY